MVIKVMAQNSDFDSDDKEINDCPSAILSAVPSQCQKVSFSQLAAGVNYKDKAIVGKLCQINPLGKRATGHIRKLQVTDALSQEEAQKKLTIFLLDDFAKDSEAAQLGGFLIITNFQLEKSTHHKPDELPFQILVKKDESQVLYGKKLHTPAPNHTKKQSVPRKRTKVQSDDENHQTLANHYDYTPLGSLQETDPRFCFNIYGIVDKCSLKVTQGKKTQILDLVLTDETDTGFTCSIFAAKDETFPDVYPGDIIRIHRMQVYKFRGRLKGKCLSSKYVLVFSKSDQGDKPRTVAKSFTFTSEDSARVDELFTWYNKKCEPMLISEINRGDYANIVCQVIGVYCAKSTDAVILKIWDGTRTNQFESANWGLKEEIIDEKLFLIAKSYYVVLSVYGQHVASAAELQPGQFIEVMDAHLYSPKTNPDDCKLCLHTGTKEGRGIRALDPQGEKVKALKERLERIILDTQNGNDTEDLLSQNNSVFLNCDLSQLTSSQKTKRNREDNSSALPSSSSQRLATTEDINMNVETLNGPLTIRNEDASSQPTDVHALNAPLASRTQSTTTTPNGNHGSQNPVISETTAAIKSGQCTQEFGGTQRNNQEVGTSKENGETPMTETNPALNKTPVELRMLLHNPGFTPASPSFFPLSSDSEEDWWNSVPTISETIGHSSMKPSSLSEVISNEVPNQFRVLCIVMSYEPQNATLLQIVHLHCPKCYYITQDAAPLIEPFEERDGLFYFYCPECKKQGEKRDWPILEYIFLLSFDLHDGPSKVEVFIWRENAVTFFQGITAEDAMRNREAAEQIFNILWTICPSSRPYNSAQRTADTFTSNPILDCCIVSYVTEDGTKYQMFDTRLK